MTSQIPHVAQVAHDLHLLPGSQTGRLNWLFVLRRYIAFVGVANLVWEFAQSPLYTIWREEPFANIAVAVIHCTAGDLLISSSALLAALIIAGNERWPIDRFCLVAALAVVGALAYTIFSEWLNTDIRGSWAYTEWMPVLPFIGSGLTPFLQWIFIPPIALRWARTGIRPSR